MEPITVILALVIGYLAGSLSFTRLVSRLTNPNVDLENIELSAKGIDQTFKVSSMGASTASMKLGPKIGCAIGLLDILKVAIPTLTYRLIYPDQTYCLIVAIAGMAGHNWPVFNRFKGGRGISAFYGGLAALDLLGAIVCAVGGLLLGIFVFRDFIMAYMAGVWLVIPWMWFRSHDPAYLIYAIVVNILFMLAMIPDLKQYFKLRREGKIELTEA
jgi:acyl phosphate:glycerol-3-phosphate acyltransferase